MRKLAIIFLLFLLTAGYSEAQIYNDVVVSCNSTSAPVAVLTPNAARYSYTCWTDPTGAVPVWLWSFPGPAVPVSVPATAGKYIPGGGLSDGYNVAATQSNYAVREGLACALTAGTTAVNIYCKWR